MSQSILSMAIPNCEMQLRQFFITNSPVGTQPEVFVPDAMAIAVIYCTMKVTTGVGPVNRNLGFTVTTRPSSEVALSFRTAANIAASVEGASQFTFGDAEERTVGGITKAPLGLAVVPNAKVIITSIFNFQVTDRVDVFQGAYWVWVKV